MTTDPDAVIRNAQRTRDAREYPTGEVWTDLLAVAEELRAQLAAAQAQLAEAQTRLQGMRLEIRAMDRANPPGSKVRADDAEARLEAVRAARDEIERRRMHIPPSFDPDRMKAIVQRSTSNRALQLIDAALSAAPQPEPDDDSDAAEDAQTDLVEGVLIHFADRLSERKAVKTASVARRIVRVLNRTAEPPVSDEPARCEHGKTEAHELWRDHEYRDDGHGHAEHAPWCKCQPRTCPGPAASGTPDGGP